MPKPVSRICTTNMVFPTLGQLPQQVLYTFGMKVNRIVTFLAWLDLSTKPRTDTDCELGIQVTADIIHCTGAKKTPRFQIDSCEELQHCEPYDKNIEDLSKPMLILPSRFIPSKRQDQSAMLIFGELRARIEHERPT